MPEASEIVAHTDRLPSMPAVYYRVKQAIDDPNGSIAKLAEAMATDSAMTARVLRIVNSPYYGYPGRIETVSRALNILGMQQVHDLVLAWSISAAFVGVRPAMLSMEAFWHNSVARAVAARQLARHARFVDAERLFVEGLISDIGHLVMYLHAPELAFEARRHSRVSGQALDEAERAIVGCDYAQVGAALVKQWGLPEPFEEPIRFQVRPNAATAHELEASMLHLAGVLADAIASGAPPAAEKDALATLGLDEAALSMLREPVSAQVAGLVETFFPHLRAA
jgi:HD-like signal output (HDOD) protein